MSAAVILVSPAPVDGYPPVQYQARLLADAGIAVELLTQPLVNSARVKFHHPGVRVTSIKPIPRNLPRLAQRFALLAQHLVFVTALTVIRLRRQAVSAEIAFDPNGLLISDHALFRPRRRVAHLHEVLQRLGENHLETRLRQALAHYDVVVVADAARAAQLHSQIDLKAPAWITPNYPLRETTVPGTMTPGPGFEVIYGGSIATMQMIDLLIRSVPLWPEEAYLTLIGDDTKPGGQALKALAASLGLSDRVRFLGWMDLDQVLPRYRQAHLAVSLLLPELVERVLNVGASNKRYQYMQAGLPQIGDRVMGLPELIEGDGIGLCVADYTEQAIADIVHYYYSRPDERLEAGRKAEMLHLTRYNYQIAFEPLLRWIKEGAGG